MNNRGPMSNGIGKSKMTTHSMTKSRWTQKASRSVDSRENCMDPMFDNFLLIIVSDGQNLSHFAVGLSPYLMT